MKHLLILFSLLTFTIYSQEDSSNEYKMNTFKIIHIEDGDIYRVGLAEVGNDYFKKSSEGEDVAKLELSSKNDNIKCRGVYYRDGFFYSVNIENDFDKTSLILKKIDKDLNIVQEEVIFSKAASNSGKFGETYFASNENGFVLAKDYTSRIKVRLDIYTYDFNTDEVYNNNIDFITRRNLKVMDFEISDQLNTAFIYDADESIGTLKTNTLKNLESYLVFNKKEESISALKLTTDENYFERSFNVCFNNEELVMANLNFHDPSNILAGYTITNYTLKDEAAISVNESRYFPFEDYASRPEWGPALAEVKKQYKKDGDKKNTGYEAFGALEIADLILKNNEAILVVREVFDVLETQPNNGMPNNSPGQNGLTRGGNNIPTNQTYSRKRYKEFQITKLNLNSEEIVWWNRLYNTPYTNGMRNSERVFQGDFFWTDRNQSRSSKAYFSYVDNDKLTLLYPTYSALYDKNGELETDLVNQRPFVPIKFSVYSYIGKSEINLSNGEVENSLFLSDNDNLGKMISATIINLNGFYIDNKNLVTPIEHLMKRISVLKIEER